MDEQHLIAHVFTNPHLLIAKESRAGAHQLLDRLRVFYFQCLIDFWKHMRVAHDEVEFFALISDVETNRVNNLNSQSDQWMIDEVSH